MQNANKLDTEFLTSWIQQHASIPCTLFSGDLDFSTGVVVRDILQSICGHTIPGTTSQPQSVEEFLKNYTSSVDVLCNEYSNHPSFPQFLKDSKTPNRLIHVCIRFYIRLNSISFDLFEF